jgi:hypothetical protein
MAKKIDRLDIIKQSARTGGWLNARSSRYKSPRDYNRRDKSWRQG